MFAFKPRKEQAVVVRILLIAVILVNALIPTPTLANSSPNSPLVSPNAHPMPAPALQTSSTFTVTKTADTNDGICDIDCSLREALRAANAQAGVDTIVIPAGLYNLTIVGNDDTSATGDLDITDSVTIQGAGATSTFISGGYGWTDRIINVISGSINITIKDVTVQNGLKTSTGAGIGWGTAATNTALTLQRVIVQNNVSTNVGAGVHVNGTGASLTIIDSAIVNNTATIPTGTSGGGIYVGGGAAANLTNVTISGNQANTGGAGIMFNSAGTSMLTNVTISNNTIQNNALVGEGAGLKVSTSTVSIKNTLIAGNFDYSPANTRPDCNGTLISAGHNIIGDTTGCTVTATTGDQFGTSASPINAQLGVLTYNGGSTYTHALLVNSPAINAGDNTGCPAADQRNITRTNCDIGAFESDGIVYTVNKTTDTYDGICDADCSLRDAIHSSNIHIGMDIVNVPAGTYTLSIAGITYETTGALVPYDRVIVQGAGAGNTTITTAAGFNDRLFTISMATTGDPTTISGLTIQNGVKSTSGGGAIYSDSPLTLSNIVLKNNSTTNGKPGGAIEIDNSPLAIYNSAFINNSASGIGASGGALFYYNGASTALQNVTFSGNSADKNGGAVYGYMADKAGMQNVTFSSNTVTNTTNAAGAAFGALTSGPILLRNVISAGNVDMGPGNQPDCADFGQIGQVLTFGHNLLGNKNGCTITATVGDQFGTSASPINAQLGALADNGGSTFTHALLSNSPAINAGDNIGCPAKDQRGIVRDATCDIGAYEYQSSPLPTTTPTNTPLPVTNTPVPPSNTPTRTNTPVPGTNTPVPPSNTPTRTNTPLPPSNTPTRTNTPVPGTNTPVPPSNTPTRTNTPLPATNTPVPPSNTPTRTNTPVPPSNTPTRTNTPVPPSNTPTRTNTPLPATPTLGPVSLAIDSPKAYAVPGQTARTNWHITGVNPAQRPVTLKFYVPEGFTPVGTPGSYDNISHILTVSATVTDSFVDWQVDINAGGPYLITAKLLELSQEYASTSITLDREYEYASGSAGGQYIAGNVQVNLPVGAISNPTTLLVGDPSAAVQPPAPLSKNTFEILAIDQTTGLEIHNLAQPVTIQASYSSDIPADAEGDLALYYYNPTTDLWERLASSVDQVNNVITAQTTHFSVFDMKVENWQASNLPSVKSFQVSEFTGAATYGVGLTVPPGPAGLQPSLSVSYNSQTVDSGSSMTQASWVGMGWSLDTGYIERDTNGTPSNYNDDTYTVVYGGVSSLLLRDGAGVWHIADENFWHPEKVGETWYLWDKSGNKYTFGETDNARGLFAVCQGGMPWRYAISKVTNIFAQSLTYQYVKDSKAITGCTNQMDTALYPSTITYPPPVNGPLNSYRVSFVTADRSDYDPSELSFFNKKKLTKVDMEWYSPVTSTWETIRSYHFTYFNDPGQDVTKVIFPNYVWKGPGSGSTIDTHTLTLASIQEFGTSGGSLPAPTFQYGDGMHMTHADNGFGATVDYAYDMWYGEFAPTSTEKKQDFGVLNEPCGVNPTDGALGNWALRTQDGTTSTNLYCQSAKLLAFKEITNTTLGTDPFKPGRLYKIKVQAKSGTNTKVTPNITGSWLDLGLFDNSQNNYQFGTQPQYYGSNYYANRITLTGTSQTYEVLRYLPVSATKLNLLINTNGAELDYYSVAPVPTYYRVSAKTIDDGNSSTPSYTYTYQYAGAATNTELNSTGVTTTNPLQEKYSEFRGHRSVTEIGPDGKRAIINWFNQGDTLKGREERTFVTEALGGNSYKVYTESSSAYSVVDLTTGTGNMPIKNNLVVTDQGIRWLRADSSVSCSYDTTGAGVTYAYDGSTPTGGTCVYQGAVGANTVGQRTTNQYAATTAYGNLLSSTVAYWNGTAWANYRATEMSYNPTNTITSVGGGVYLVGLPASQKTFGCDLTGACTNLLGASYNYYDLATNNATAPTQGKLTRSRTWLNTVNGVDQYSQVDLSNFDVWGNAGTTTTYNGYITLAATGVPTGARSQTTTYDATYGTFATASTNSLGQTTSMDYDYKLGVVTALHDINDQPGYSVISTAAYDQFGRIQTIILPGDTSANPSTTITYYDSERPFRVKVSQWIENNTYFNLSRSYDGMGRMIRMTTIGAEVMGAITDIRTDFAYDGYDRLMSQTVPYTTEPNPPTTTNLYDVLGRTIRTTAPNGEHADTTYANVTTVADPLGGAGLIPGQQITVKDAATRITSSLSDPFGRAISVTPPIGPGVTYTYDQLDRLKTALYAGKTTTLNYDIASRKTSMSDPSTGNWAYEYDALGNMTKQTDARSCIATMIYDNLGRLTSTAYSGPEIGSKKCSAASSKPIQLTYDQGNDKGRLNNITDASGTRSWVYDVRGRVMIERYSIDSTFTFDITHTYAADQLKSTTYPDGEIVSYAYTPQKLLKSMSSPLGMYVQSETYDASGRATSRVLGLNLLTNTYNYNAWTSALGPGRLSSVTLNRNSDSASLQNLSYVYAAGTGNINTITDALAGPQTQTFGYDNLDRLTSASALGGTSGTFNTELYEYDAITGDLKKKANVTMNYADPTHAHAVTSTDTGTNTYTYDENGNQITRAVAGDGTYTLFYDAANHLVQVNKVPSGGGATITTNYIYDGQGKLVVKKTAADETVYVGEFYERTFPLINGAPVDDSPVPFGTILPFAATACPIGWALVSGVSTDILYNSFPQGAPTGLGPTAPGGSDTHYHVYTDVPQHSHIGGTITTSTDGGHAPRLKPYASTSGATNGNYPETGTGSLATGTTVTESHSHTFTGATNVTGVANPTTDLTTILPPYLNMLFCRKSVVDFQGVPQNAVAIFDLIAGQALPANWTHFTALDGKFPRGAAIYGGIGGAATHNHSYSQVPAHSHTAGTLTTSTVTHNHSYTYLSSAISTTGTNLLGTTTANSSSRGSSNQAVEATAAHTHTILSLQTGSFGTAGTLFTSAASNMPPYQEVPYAQKTLDDGLEFPVGSVMMWEGTNCPATWQRYTLLDGRFPLGAGFVNAAGGAATHTHTYTQLPPHTHNQGTLTLVASGAHQDSINYRSPSTVPGSAGVFGSANPAAFKSGLLSNSGAHNHNGALTGSTGVTGVATATTQTASNLPPYTSLVFCKKISATQISAGTTSTVHKYYFSGAQRVAMRENTTLYFLAGDHLGSTSLIIDANGNKVGEMRYKPWGETRYSWSSLPSFPTNYQYTGQRNNPDIGLYYYNARWYDPSLGRFTQVDTNIPLQQGTQSWDRYAYVNNNPSRYTDPSGHCFFEPLEFIFCATVAVAFIAEAAPVISQFLAEEGPALEPEIEEAALEAAPAIEEAFAEGEQALINAEEELRTFYHATNAQGEESILNNGINLDKGRPNLDFNPANQKGFYLTQDYEQAQSWANKFGEDGRIVQFKIPQSQLNNLNSKIFSQGNDEWLDFALRGRSGLLQHAFDFVEGPYLKLKDLTPAGHQLAIFTQSAVHIFNNYIMK